MSAVMPRPLLAPLLDVVAAGARGSRLAGTGLARRRPGLVASDVLDHAAFGGDVDPRRGMFRRQRRIDPVHDLPVAVGLNGLEFKRLARAVLPGIASDRGKLMNWPLFTLPSGPVHVQTI